MKNIFSVFYYLLLKVVFFLFPLRMRKQSFSAQQEKRAQMIIFDFDDTILPTSALCNNSRDIHELDQLDIQCETVLKRCLEKCPVFIVTNSENDWVRLSSLKYLPRTHSVILNSIDVISARSLYEKQYPNHPTLWKFNVFRSIVDQFVLSWSSVDEQIRNEQLKGIESSSAQLRSQREERELDVISFGDSEIERVALLDLQKMWNGKSKRSYYLGKLRKFGGLTQERNGSVKMNVKNVKFINNPTTEQVRKQLKTVQESLDFIFNNNGGLDLALQMNPTNSHSQSQATPQSLPSSSVSSPIPSPFPSTSSSPSPLLSSPSPLSASSSTDNAVSSEPSSVSTSGGDDDDDDDDDDSSSSSVSSPSSHLSDFSISSSDKPPRTVHKSFQTMMHLPFHGLLSSFPRSPSLDRDRPLSSVSASASASVSRATTTPARSSIATTCSRSGPSSSFVPRATYARINAHYAPPTAPSLMMAKRSSQAISSRSVSPRSYSFDS